MVWHVLIGNGAGRRLWDEYEVIDAFSSDNNKCFVAETTDKKLVGFIFGDEIKKRNSWRYGYPTSPLTD